MRHVNDVLKRVAFVRLPTRTCQEHGRSLVWQGIKGDDGLDSRLSDVDEAGVS